MPPVVLPSQKLSASKNTIDISLDTIKETSALLPSFYGCCYKAGTYSDICKNGLGSKSSAHRHLKPLFESPELHVLNRKKKDIREC